MERRTATATGLAAGFAAAAVGAAGTAVAARQATRKRRRLDGLDEIEAGSEDPFGWTPGEVLTVKADDGTDLHVEVDAPTGYRSLPTVVFSHGYCLSTRSWIHQRRALVEAGYRCVLWDQRGHGRSGRGPDLTDHIDQLGSDLAHVIAAAAPTGPLILVGHSMGGMTMMAFGEQHPAIVAERVVAAAFIATSAGGLGLVSVSAGKVLGAVAVRFGPGLLANIAARQTLWKGLRMVGRDVESFFVSKYSFASPVSEETVRFCADMLLGTDLEVVGSFLPGLERHDKRQALAVFAGVDTLVLNGEADELTPPEHSLAIVEALPGAEHVVVTEAGHLVMIEHPTLVTAQLIALFERARGDGSATSRPRLLRRVTDTARRRTVQQRLAERAASR